MMTSFEIKKAKPQKYIYYAVSVGWRVRGMLLYNVSGFPSQMCCISHLTEGDVGGMTLLIFLPKCFIPDVLNFCDKAAVHYMNTGTDNLRQKCSNFSNAEVANETDLSVVHKATWRAWGCPGPMSQTLATNTHITESLIPLFHKQESKMTVTLTSPGLLPGFLLPS